MKIVCVSDLHGIWDRESPLFSDGFARRKWPKGDVFVCAGDATTYGEFEEYTRFNRWCAGLPYEHKILIAGNHCRSLYYNNNLIRELFTNITYVEDESFEIKNVKFFGTPWSLEFNNWFFMGNEEFLKSKYVNIPEDTEIIISHSPPYGIRDNVSKNKRIGSVALLSRIKEIKPKLVIFGHAHDDYGIEEIDNTKFVNCSLLNDSYKFVNKPVLIQFDSRRRRAKKIGQGHGK